MIESTRGPTSEVPTLGATTAYDDESANKGSVSGHFRIWKDVYESLEDEARARKVSLNTLVNQLLSDHTRDEMLYEKAGVVKLPRSTFGLMLEFIPEERLLEFAKEVAKHWPTTMILARKGVITVDGILSQLHDESKMGFVSLYEVRNNGTRRVSLLHEFGQKYSTILGASTESLFALVGVRPKITTTSSLVTIEY